MTVWMRRISAWSYTLALSSLPLLAQPGRIAGPIDDSHRVVLEGSLHPHAQARFDRGPVDPAQKIGYVTLVLGPSADQQAALERLLAEQQDPRSPNYHRWLTPREFGDRFGASRSDYAAVVAWLESHGLRVEDVARARNWVAFSGEARQVESALGAEIHRYLVDGEEHFANATGLHIPAALGHLVSGVRGLNDFDTNPGPVVPQFTTSSGANQLAPDDWATIYNVAPLYGMGIDGSGQRIAIIGRSSLNLTYVSTFRSLFGLPPAQVEMHLIGPDPGVTNAAGEAALDVEWSGAIARNATIVYVYANNFDVAAQAAVDQNLAPVMSESFGTCEPSGAVGNRAIAQQANAQGITWLASSGDSGAAGCDPHGFFGSSGGLVPASGGRAAMLPASYPEVTAVGGTQFNEGSGQYWRGSNNANGGSAISYIPEVAWNETGVGGLLASGGGASIYFPKPAWQTGPGVPDDNARDLPDVAFAAAGNHDPYAVINANGQRATGGTSAGAPSFAGVVALLNQYLVSKSLQAQPGLGNINPQLYRLARTTTDVFHDITQGNNIVPCAKGSPDCDTGSLGVAAGPGYDLATGLGSIDVFNLVTAWNNAAAATTTLVTANPARIASGDPVQLTATVRPASSSQTGVPTGTVTFATGGTILGTAALANAAGVATATLTVTGTRLPAGSPTVVAAYSGDGDFNPSTGSISVAVASQSAGSAVVVSITPNPAHQGQVVRVTLTEEAGVATTLTGWTINGVDNFFRFAADFGSNDLPAFGAMSATFPTAVGVSIPSNRVYVFTGKDADGRAWSQQYTLTLQGLLQIPGMLLFAAPGSVMRNPAADPSCQWSQQLLLQEENGFAVQLTRFTAGGSDWTGRLQQIFGTTHLAPMGSLQGSLCWPAGTTPQNVDLEIDGIDQTGSPVAAALTASFTETPSSPATLSVPKDTVTLIATSPSQVVTASLALNLTDAGQAWTVFPFPANQATAWLKATPANGKGSQTIAIAASSAGLANGVYSATLVFQAVNAIPQFIEVPVVFVVGAAAGMSVTGVANGASFQQAYAPGMILSVFGAQLAPSVQQAAGLPLPANLAGVSATVNGVSAPLYYVSPAQLNIQIPYETGAGPAALGVNNNGRVASYAFPVAPSAPGIFTDSSQALVPSSSAKRGDTLVLFMTGDGDVSPPLATGATPFAATPLSFLPQPKLPVQVTVGGVPATIGFVGVPPGLAGVTQLNFVVPAGVAPGVQPVVVTVNGVLSQSANITIAAQ